MTEALAPYAVFLTVIIAIITAFLTFLFGVFLEKFKNKRMLITYEITNTSIGVATMSDIWGNVAITHNGEPMNSLDIFKLVIENSSNIDSENVPVNIWCDLNSKILSYSTFNNGTQEPILLDNNFFSNSITNENEVQDHIDNNPDEQNLPDDLSKMRSYYSRNKRFVIDVLNRKSSCEFSILVGNDVNGKSQLFFSVPKKSIFLSKNIDEAVKTKKEGVRSMFIGAIIIILTGITLHYLNSPIQIVLIILTLIGLVNIFLGAVIVKSFNFLKSFFR